MRNRLRIFRFADGTPMSDAARSHYMECIECIMAVGEMLDSHAAASGAAGKDAAQAEAVRQAVERGRRVLERDLGIPLPHAIK